MTQTKQAKHTPGPWRVRQSILRSNPQIEQDSDSHYQICATLDHKETDEANVAFIVRSVNSREELLGALQYTVELFEQIESDQTSLLAETDLSEKQQANRERFYKFELTKAQGKIQDALTKARQVIAHATGE